MKILSFNYLLLVIEFFLRITFFFNFIFNYVRIHWFWIFCLKILNLHKKNYSATFQIKCYSNTFFSTFKKMFSGNLTENRKKTVILWKLFQFTWYSRYTGCRKIKIPSLCDCFLKNGLRYHNLIQSKIFFCQMNIPANIWCCYRFLPIFE